MRQRTRHVVRQNQEALNQRSDQNSNHRKGNIADQITKSPANRHKAKECDDSRHSGAEHRRRHPAGCIFGRNDWGLAKPSRSEISVFTHNDRIINNDPERNDKREKADHINRQTGGIHDGNRRQHGHWNARSNPKRSTGVQEQK